MVLKPTAMTRAALVAVALFGLLVGHGCSSDEAGTAAGDDSDNQVQQTDFADEGDDALEDGETESDADDEANVYVDGTVDALDTDGADAADRANENAAKSPPVVTRFVAMGDTGEGNDAQKRVAAGAQRRCDEVGGRDGFIMLGDNIYDTGPKRAEDEQFRTKIDQPYMNMNKGPVRTDNTLRDRFLIYV